MGSPRIPKIGTAGKPCGPLYLAPRVINNSVKTGRYPNESAHRASILSRSERLERKEDETATVETGLFMGFSSWTESGECQFLKILNRSITPAKGISLLFKIFSSTSFQ
jgi:hypothetical protein